MSRGKHDKSQATERRSPKRQEVGSDALQPESLDCSGGGHRLQALERMVRPERIELEPFCGRERSGSPQAKSRAERGIWGNTEVFGETGAPGENRTPNLLVRSQALYPIELRAHPLELCLCIIKETESFRPTRSAQNAPSRIRFAPPDRPKCRAGCAN